MLPGQIMYEADLKINFERAALSYATYFCMKHGVSFDGWVGDDPGTVGWFHDGIDSTPLYFEDVRFDIDNHVPIAEIFIWYNEFHEGGVKNERYLNFQTWCRASKFWDYNRLNY